MSEIDAPTQANRLGNWALVLGILGLVALMGPAHVVVVVLGAVVSVAALVLGINGVLAFAARRASNRPQAVAGIVLGVVGTLLWFMAIIGVVLGLEAA